GGELSRSCSCTSADIIRYRARLSGPVADRIDMHVQLTPVPVRALAWSGEGETSAVVRDRVQRAREIQLRRYGRVRGVYCNAQASGRWLDAHATVTAPARELLSQAAECLHLTARGYHRALRVSRTIADLDGAKGVEVAHVAEALRYRPEALKAPAVNGAGDLHPSTSADTLGIEWSGR
ncbi:MAG: ATP-binding protein, partial [Gemmatimonadaceae bacterium]